MATKRGSNHNSVKYGIFAGILLTGDSMGEANEDYFGLLKGLRKTYRPTNCLQETLVAKLALLFIRISRLYQCDLQIAPMLFSKVKEGLKKERPKIEMEYVGTDKEYHVVVFPKGPSADLLVRYEAGIERQIARTLEQLERLQPAQKKAPYSASDAEGTDAA